MNPLERVRIEKAAADCGFEMPLAELDGTLQLRSARFPEVVTVRPLAAEAFEVDASNHALLRDATTLHGYASLYDTLRTLAAHARTLPNRVADAFRHQTAALPRSTEAERLVIQRVGQDLYRAALLDFWQGRCCVTGLALAPLLRASHIKPWAACASDNERLDVFNGLLLAPHVDALFDGGWITFADNGTLQVSDELPPDAAVCLGLKMDWAIQGLAPAHGAYLQFHRSQVFRASAPAA